MDEQWDVEVEWYCPCGWISYSDTYVEQSMNGGCALCLYCGEGPRRRVTVSRLVR